MDAKREHRPMLYFVPGKRKHITADDYERLGLGHLHGTSPACRELLANPEGAGPGCFFMPRVEPTSGTERIAAQERGPAASCTHMDVSRATHTWTKCNGGAFWICWEHGKHPGPDDLARLGGLGGDACEMGDGNRWLLPKSSAVPLSYCLDDNGDFGLKNDPVYAGFDEAALALQGYAFGETIDREEFVRHIVTALAINYRLGFFEALALGLVTDGCGDEAAGIIVEREKLLSMMREKMEAEKKTNNPETPDG